MKTAMRVSAVWYAVARWEEAKYFYGEVLGLNQAALSDHAGWAAYSTDGGFPLIIMLRPELVGRGGGATVTFEHPDLDELRERLLDAAVQVDETLQESESVQIMTFFDPDGNRLEASQRL